MISFGGGVGYAFGAQVADPKAEYTFVFRTPVRRLCGPPTSPPLRGLGIRKPPTARASRVGSLSALTAYALAPASEMVNTVRSMLLRNSSDVKPDALNAVLAAVASGAAVGAIDTPMAHPSDSALPPTTTATTTTTVTSSTASSSRHHARYHRGYGLVSTGAARRTAVFPGPPFDFSNPNNSQGSATLPLDGGDSSNMYNSLLQTVASAARCLARGAALKSPHCVAYMATLLSVAQQAVSHPDIANATQVSSSAAASAAAVQKDLVEAAVPDILWSSGPEQSVPGVAGPTPMASADGAPGPSSSTTSS